MAEEKRKGILQALDTRTKVLGLIALISEDFFWVSRYSGFNVSSIT